MADEATLVGDVNALADNADDADDDDCIWRLLEVVRVWL